MNNSLLEKLLNQDFGVLALIDPDFKNDDILDELINSINMNNFSGVLVGGSTISDKNYHLRIKKIKKYINKPLILFPGSSEQISKYADAILFTTLLSGRNPKYLIEEQIKERESKREQAGMIGSFNDHDHSKDYQESVSPSKSQRDNNSRKLMPMG